MSNRPGAPAELPPMSGDGVAPAPRPKTPRASKIKVKAEQPEDDAVGVKHGGRQDLALIGMGIFCLVLVVVFGIVLAAVANARPCGNTNGCVHAPHVLYHPGRGTTCPLPCSRN